MFVGQEETNRISSSHVGVVPDYKVNEANIGLRRLVAAEVARVL